MAYVAPRKNAAGEITSYQVKWRLGGGRTAAQQVERFTECLPEITMEEAGRQAEIFKEAVNAAGQQWPPGWVKGVGYVQADDPEAEENARCEFEAYARASIANRTGIEEHYRHAITRELETYLLPTFAGKDVRSPKDFCKATVGAWVNAMAATVLWSGAKRKQMSPKTLRNLHGLLSSVLKEAVEEEPPLRARNPCSLTRLPRIDDDGVEAGDEDMTFLLPEEVEAIAAGFDNPMGAKLTRDKYATGARWGEITALARRYLAIDQRDGKPKAKIHRAWKRQVGGGRYLGKPKSARSRRTIRLAESTWQGLLADGLEEMGPEELIYHDGNGEPLPYWVYYTWFMVAVGRAHEAGTLPKEKQPTPHDLRHSHAAALISAGHSLTYVQRRLGHESITTTSDRYGHLLPQADDDAMETIEATLKPGAAPPGAVMPLRVPEQGDSRRVFVVHCGVHAGAHVEGFWNLDHAQGLAEQLEADLGAPVLVEAWSVPWWNRQVPGGVNRARHRMPERALVWWVGPAVYGPDGVEYVRRPEDHEPRPRTVWEWEELYTEEPALGRALWRPGGETEAEAWGVDRAAVLEAYGTARADALRVCSLNPALRPEPEGERETAG